MAATEAPLLWPQADRQEGPWEVMPKGLKEEGREAGREQQSPHSGDSRAQRMEDGVCGKGPCGQGGTKAQGL